MEKTNAPKILHPINIILVILYLVGGYIVASISEQSGIGFLVTTVGLGLFGLIAGFSVLEKKFLTLWFGFAGSVLGVVTGLLVGHFERSIEWGILLMSLGNMIGYASYEGWKGILIGAGIGCAIALLAGTRMSFDDNLKIANPVLHILLSILTGILIGGFWGGAFQMAFSNSKKKE